MWSLGKEGHVQRGWSFQGYTHMCWVVGGGVEGGSAVLGTELVAFHMLGMCSILLAPQREAGFYSCEFPTLT